MLKQSRDIYQNASTSSMMGKPGTHGTGLGLFLKWEKTQKSSKFVVCLDKGAFEFWWVWICRLTDSVILAIDLNCFSNNNPAALAEDGPTAVTFISNTVLVLPEGCLWGFPADLKNCPLNSVLFYYYIGSGLQSLPLNFVQFLTVPSTMPNL